MTRKLIPAALLLCLLLSTFAAEPPQIVWASDPVRPDEVVLVQGEGFTAGCTVELSRLGDQTWETIRPLQSSPQSLKFVVPKNWPMGIWACRVRSGDAVSETVVLNAPDPWWWNGDAGSTATPGGWLRVFGKSLRLGDSIRAELRGPDGWKLALKPFYANAYVVQFPLPAVLRTTDYELFIQNGLGDETTWRSAGTVLVRSPEPWDVDLFNVKDFGPKPGEALLAALKKAEENGGGVVFLPRGRYPVADTLVIPPHTILRGEAMELVSLYWPDFDTPPKELVTGGDFGIESLSLYCQQHRDVISTMAASQRFFARRVRVRANCYFMIEDAAKEFRGRHGPVSHKQCGAALLLRGNNFEVSDCDIYASNYALRILKGKTGLVTRNRLLYGGRGYSIENTERLIFEENLVAGNNLLSIGNDITTFWTNSCRHIFFARNRLQQMFGADREMMTLDAAGGAYSGKVAAVNGTNLTLAADPEFRDYAPKPHTDWVGAAVQILDGKGAGQYRFVTSHSGREWQVDRPWTVAPDANSRISIAPFRGKNLFIGNTFEDGGAFQLYGAAHDSIVAENKGSRMDGFLVWGLNPHGWGHQPSWGCQFLDNEILEGNGYGPRSAGFGTIASDESRTFDGPLVRQAIFRRNVLQNNARFSIGGATEDVLVEHCTIRHNENAIELKSSTKGVLLRDNVFEGVTRTVETKP